MKTNDLNIIVVEDDRLLGQQISDQLSDLGYTSVLVCSTYEQGATSIKMANPDLLILDIDLGNEQSGIDLGKLATERNEDISIIFLTGMHQDEVFNDAKSLKPSAFLHKPFNAKLLSRAIDLSVVNRTMETSKPLNDTIFIKDNKRYRSILISGICYLQAAGSYCEVHTLNDKFVVSQNLSQCCTHLPNSHFFRAHRSFMVNLAHINSLSGNEIQIKNTKVPLGNGKREELLERIRLMN